MNGFEVIHGWNATDHTVLLVYNTSMGMKIFTFWLPGWCAIFSRGENVGHRTIFDIGDEEHPRPVITLPLLSLQPRLGVTKAEDIVVEGPSH